MLGCKPTEQILIKYWEKSFDGMMYITVEQSIYRGCGFSISGGFYEESGQPSLEDGLITFPMRKVGLYDACSHF